MVSYGIPGSFSAQGLPSKQDREDTKVALEPPRSSTGQTTAQYWNSPDIIISPMPSTHRRGGPIVHGAGTFSRQSLGTNNLHAKSIGPSHPYLISRAQQQRGEKRPGDIMPVPGGYPSPKRQKREKSPDLEHFIDGTHGDRRRSPGPAPRTRPSLPAHSEGTLSQPFTVSDDEDTGQPVLRPVARKFRNGEFHHTKPPSEEKMSSEDGSSSSDEIAAMPKEEIRRIPRVLGRPAAQSNTSPKYSHDSIKRASDRSTAEKGETRKPVNGSNTVGRIPLEKPATILRSANSAMIDSWIKPRWRAWANEEVRGPADGTAANERLHSEKVNITHTDTNVSSRPAHNEKRAAKQRSLGVIHKQPTPPPPDWEGAMAELATISAAAGAAESLVIYELSDSDPIEDPEVWEEDPLDGNTRDKAANFSSASAAPATVPGGPWRDANRNLQQFEDGVKAQQHGAHKPSTTSQMKGKPPPRFNRNAPPLRSTSPYGGRSSKVHNRTIPLEVTETNLQTSIRYPPAESARRPTIEDAEPVQRDNPVVDMTQNEDEDENSEELPTGAPQKSPFFANEGPSTSWRGKSADVSDTSDGNGGTGLARRPNKSQSSFASFSVEPAMEPSLGRELLSVNPSSASSSTGVKILPPERNPLTVDLAFFGSQRVDDKRYKLSWTAFLFTLKDSQSRVEISSLFEKLSAIEFCRDPSLPLLIVEPEQDTITKLSVNYPGAFSAGFRQPCERQLCFRFTGTDPGHEQLWSKLYGTLQSKKPKMKNMQFLDVNAAKTRLGMFERYAKEYAPQKDALKRDLAGRTMDVVKPVNGQRHSLPPLLPRRGAADASESKGPGMPIPIPSNTRERTRASVGQIPESTEPKERKVQSRIPTVATRMSTRASARQSLPERRMSPDPNELILIWPESGTGAVNITHGDVKRLLPHEFLNDTLIEFGLKLWHKNFSEEHPELAQEIHVFNTFFYKKLNNKDHAVGYESVRKWTNKIDIFSKKYVIVPINEHLHWYLAIICNPQFILKPPPPQALAKPRKSMRLGAVQESRTTDVHIDGDGHPASRNPVDSAASSRTAPRSRQSSEGEVEQLAQYTQEMDISKDGADVKEDVNHVTSPREQQKDIAEPPMSPELGADSPSFEPPEEEAAKDDSEALPSVEPDGQASMLLGSAAEMKKTQIFTFDSLDGRHSGAISTLKRYLQLEAKDKKNLDLTSDAAGKSASVPTQPNFCDCGLYLLHFVEKFMTNPEYFIRLLTTKYKKSELPDWDAVWDKPSVDGKRDELRARIDSLSMNWKQRRQEQNAQKEALPIAGPRSGKAENVVEVEDDDDDIQEVVMVAEPRAGKGKRKIDLGDEELEQPKEKGKGSRGAKARRLGSCDDSKDAVASEKSRPNPKSRVNAIRLR